MTKKPKGRRQKELETRRQDILDAAVILFHRQGFHQTTVRQIADLADFGVGTVYRLFPDGKEAIYRSAQERVVTCFEKTTAEFLAGATNEQDVIRRYMKAGAHVYQTYPREMALYLRGNSGLATQLGRGLDPELAQRYLDCAQPVARALVDGARAGRFRRLNPELSVICLRTMINAVLCAWLEAPESFPLESSLDFIETLFFKGLTSPEDPE